MPQINRIRVNNVKYNFGTQFYDDFIMRFSCRNSLYDLANGGGKSVLMLLLLQNLIPNCTLDDKQPVEKLFRGPNTSQTIHSLVEWKLDSCDMRDGYRYMTTGFCARKGRDNGEEKRNSETANIEYFNYCIFYKEFGENDIKNLPLSNGEERITYNGLKAYLRDLPKKDLGVEVHIFERKGDYQNFISQYGLYESQWEIVRGINKTEGHVRTYFENNYKTTRKVIEDLLIEEIIEKSYNNRIRKGATDDEDMARTLLDIKDKLIELSRRRGEVGNYNNQIMLLSSFADELNSFREVFAGKNKAQEELVNCLISCRKALASKKQQIAEIEAEIQFLDEQYFEIKKSASAAEIESEYLELEEVDALIKEAVASIDKMRAEIENDSRRLTMSILAEEYKEYQRNASSYKVTKELMSGSFDDKDLVLSDLAALCAAKLKYFEQKCDVLNTAITDSEENIKSSAFKVNEMTESGRELFAELNGYEGRKKAHLTALDEENAALSELLKEVGLLVPDDVPAKLLELEDRFRNEEKNITEIEKQIEVGEKQIELIREKVTALKIREANEKTNKIKLAKQLEELKDKIESLDKLKEIYGEQNIKKLPAVMEHIHNSVMAEKINARKELDRLTNYAQRIEHGRLPEYEKYYRTALDYLKNRYTDVLSGCEYLDGMEEAERKELLKRFPQAAYAVFAGESYEQIAADKVLGSLDTGSYIIPVFNSNDIESYSKNAYTGAFKNMDFMCDTASLNAEIEKTNEEIHRLSEICEKATDRSDITYRDILHAKSILDENPDKVRSSYDEAVISCMSVEKELEELEDMLEKQIVETDSLRSVLLNEKSIAKALQEECGKYETINLHYNRICSIREKISDINGKLPEINNAYRKNTEALEAEQARLQEEEINLKARKDDLAGITADFVNNFKPYINPDIPACDIAESELDEKAAVLRQSLLTGTGDMADKEQLLANYQRGMDKCVSTMKYNGYSLEKVEKLYDEGELCELSEDLRIQIKNHIDDVNNMIVKCETENDAKLARKNRIEGSIEHGRHLHEEKYGEFVRRKMDNPSEQIVRFKHELSLLKEKKLACQNNIKQLESANKDGLLMEKDLERIIKNAGLEISENLEDTVTPAFEVTIEKYEEIQKKYFSFVREEEKLKNDFFKRKQALLDDLGRNSAYELAEEIRQSMNAPVQIADVDAMVKGLNDTNECIILERDRIEKSMSDMERIKESFEQRCIQICSNIKSELDRLPKLSRINLDDEIISIITLNIPYIKEEMFKDRMSVYINETVAAAETFMTPEEKLKYIKGRLSWKRLFSVIVTDMNSIKLSLYKREHIKDQSRYLRYEEAVGSTGQSQGIYIQFLIAIINYISSINALGKDTTAIGKTIFIDNPFGAAKDVYIWEPIFKMLATNHTQLIVPARGATPAITKMFDVNYILGQKMVAGRQQTVVVDYRSQIDAEAMDYSKLDFEQVTFDF